MAERCRRMIQYFAPLAHGKGALYWPVCAWRLSNSSTSDDVSTRSGRRSGWIWSTSRWARRLPLPSEMRSRRSASGSSRSRAGFWLGTPCGNCADRRSSTASHVGSRRIGGKTEGSGKEAVWARKDSPSTNLPRALVASRLRRPTSGYRPARRSAKSSPLDWLSADLRPTAIWRPAKDQRTQRSSSSKRPAAEVVAP